MENASYSAVTVATKVGACSLTVYNIFRDHLGTITHLKTGNNITEFSFDAWGRRRDKDDWSYTLTSEPSLFADRGFTGHEFLSDFNLYNMNGRLYDPVVGRFLSPDPYITDPSFSQSYNRYAYALNNPLKYNDPNGELPFLAILGIVWAGNYAIGWLDNVINKKMSAKEAFRNTSLIAGVNFSPSDMSKQNNYGFSHSQIEAQKAAMHEEIVSQRLDKFVAMQSRTGDFGTGLSLVGEGMWLFGESRSISLYQQGFRKGINGNYQLVGRNLSLFGDQPMTSATKPFSSLTTVGKGLSNFGTGLGVASVAIDTYDYTQGNLSGTRYGYHLTGTGAAFGAAYFLGGPIGAATGGVFFLGEKAWDSFLPVWNDIVSQYWQFENAMNNGWRPR